MSDTQRNWLANPAPNALAEAPPSESAAEPALTAAERAAVGQYSSNSMWVNGPAPAAESTRRLLDSAIDKHKLDDDTLLYRGFGASPDLLDRLEPGNEVPLSGGHVSTTLNRKVAQGFADDLYSKDERSVMAVIHAPRGTNAMPVATAPEFEKDPDNPVDQQEMLLPRSMRFHVMSKRELGGERYEVHVAPVANGAALSPVRPPMGPGR